MDHMWSIFCWSGETGNSCSEVHAQVEEVKKSPMLQLCKVTEGLLISNARSACSDELIQQEEVTLCINVSKQQPFPSTRVATFRVPVFDDPHEDLSRYFDRCTDAIHSEKARGGRTVVYCKNGRSRSATVCVAYLMKHQGLSLTEAFEMVKSARSVVEPNPGFWAQLELYEQELKIRRTQQTNKCLQFFQFSIQRIFSQRRHTS